MKCFLFSVKCVTKCPLAQIQAQRQMPVHTHTQTHSHDLNSRLAFITLHSLNWYFCCCFLFSVFCFCFCLVQSSMTDFAATNSAAQSQKRRNIKQKAHRKFAQAVFALLCRRLLLLVPLCLLNTQGQRQRNNTIIIKKRCLLFPQNAIAQIISINETIRRRSSDKHTQTHTQQ